MASHAHAFLTGLSGTGWLESAPSECALHNGKDHLPIPAASNVMPHVRAPFAAITSGEDRVRPADLLVAMLFAGVGALAFTSFGHDQSFQENGIIEIAQNTLLMLSAGTFLVATRRSRSNACLAIMWGLTLLSASLFFRELEIRETPLEPFLGTFFAWRIHYALLLFFWLTLLLAVFADFREIWARSLEWGLSRQGLWLAAGIALYLTGDMAEKSLFTDNSVLAEMVEETLELFATLSVFSASYVTARRQRPLTTSRQMLSPDDARSQRRAE